MKKYLGHLYWILSLILFCLSVIAAFIIPDKSAVLYWCGLAFPIFAVNTFFIVMYKVIFKKQLYFLFALIPIIFFGSNYYHWGHYSKKIDVSKSLNVLSLNAYGEKLFDHKSSDFKSWINYLSKAADRPDILLLQEYKSKKNSLPLSKDKFHIHSSEKSALTIWSNYPILKKDEINNEETPLGCIWADILIKGDTVRVYNFHLKSNWISALLEKTEHLVDSSFNHAVEDGKKVADKIYKSAMIRAKQAQIIQSHIARSPFPVIVGGDMNETAQTFVYRTLRGQNKDSFRAARRGIHSTYNGSPPTLRIDYLFFPIDWKIERHRVLPFHISDHNAILATVSI